MSLALDNNATGAPAPFAVNHGRSGFSMRVLSQWLIGLAVFLGAFVLNEPAPYEIFLVVIMAAFLLFGMRLTSIALSLGTLFILFNIGGLISMLTLAETTGIPLYLAVSLFLGLTSVFWCAAVEADMGRLRTIMRAYVVGSAITALLGIAGYFDLFPGSDLFLRYGRAKGGFEDPNVFGPFLILPIIYLIYGLLYRNMVLAPLRLFFLSILALGLLLSFSRGAWGMLIVAGGLFYLLLLMTETRAQQKLKLLVLGGLGVALASLVLVVALQFDAVYDMFEQRARLVQDYDGRELGRFARHALGFQWALENPLGIGPLEFGRKLGEDTHNIWVKSLMAYGWLGFFSYLTMTVTTLVGGGRLLGRKRPWQPYLICLYATFVAHIVVAWVIDIDHWRHVYLIIGLIWGCMGLEARHQRTRETSQQGHHQPVPA